MPSQVYFPTRMIVESSLKEGSKLGNGSDKNMEGYLDGSSVSTAAMFCVQALAMPAFVVGDDQRILAWNDALVQSTKIEAKETANVSIFTLIDDDSVKLLEAAFQSLVAGRRSAVCDLAFLNPEIRLSLRISPLNIQNGAETGVMCFVENISDASKTVGGLETHPISSFPMATLDLSLSVTGWNFQIESLSGYREHEIVGSVILNYIPNESHRLRLERALSSVVQGNGTSKTCLVDFVLGNGALKPMLMTLSSGRDNGSVQATFSDSSDIGDHDSVEVSQQTALHEPSMAYREARELRFLIDSANTAIFGIDAEGFVNEWNQKTTEITGFSAEEALGQPLVQTFISFDLQEALNEVMKSALEGWGTTNLELEISTKEGEIRYLLVSLTPRRNVNDSIVGVVAMAQDITDAFKHDRAIAAMADELRKLIDTANVPIFGIGGDGLVNEWNDMTAEITGYTRDEALGSSFLDTFIVPDIRESVQHVLDDALEGRGTSNYELEFRTKTNEIRQLLVNATTRRDAENNVVGVVGVAQDVTEAVQRDRAVAGMALELRQLIDTANAPIFGIDIDGNVNEWNRRTSEITGYTKEEAFDEPLVETFIAKSMQGKVQEILASALAGNETSNYELEFVSKSGKPIFLKVNATTRRDPENAVVGVVGVAQDVTEDRQHAQKLREMQYLQASQEAKVETERNMTAYFAHELRNPLGAIDSALNALPDDLPESAKSLISGMQLCSGFMSSIMNNLLDVRKMEEGKMKLSKSPISLDDLLQNVHKMLLPSVRPGVDFLKVCNTKGKNWVLGDAHRIQQVMTNVVTNAIKYTVTGSITLVIGWEDDKVKFECIDTGPGIPKSEQEKLFQRFVQRGGAPGTGLGLAIAKHLVDLTGGSIRFDSDPTVKAGTTCVVLMTLPLCDAPETIVETSTALIQEKISFLIIDDIKMNRMMLKRRIKKGIAPNAEITEAATGESALEICGKVKFDVIVVDQFMEEAGGVMVGTDVVFAMRRMRMESVVIGCSGNDMGSEFFEAGADWVWQKPMPSNAKIIQDLRVSLGKRLMHLQQ